MQFPTIQIETLSGIKEQTLRDAFLNSAYVKHTGYVNFVDNDGINLTWRSEERRVGKEC